MTFCGRPLKIWLRYHNRAKEGGIAPSLRNLGFKKIYIWYQERARAAESNDTEL